MNESLNKIESIMKRDSFGEFLFTNLAVSARSISVYMRTGGQSAGTQNQLQRDLQILVNRLCQKFEIPTLNIKVTKERTSPYIKQSTTYLSISEILENPLYKSETPAIYFEDPFIENQLNWILDTIFDQFIQYLLQQVGISSTSALAQKEIYLELFRDKAIEFDEAQQKHKLQEALEDKIFDRSR